MRILLMNVNTTASMTATMVDGALAVARPGTHILGVEPTWGVPSVEGYYESYLSAVSILDRLEELTSAGYPGGPVTFDAMVWAGFGEHGKEAAMERYEVPILNITDSAAHLACLVGRKYGVVTTLERAVGMIEENLTIAGVIAKCAGIRATGLGVLELEEDHERTVQRFVDAAASVIADGAEVLLLGCGGMSGLADRLTAELGVPIVDGVQAAVKLAESLVDLGLTTSKCNSYAAPLPKPRPGWPLHAR